MDPMVGKRILYFGREIGTITAVEPRGSRGAVTLHFSVDAAERGIDYSSEDSRAFTLAVSK